MAKGYISIHRKIWDNDIWQTKEPFDVRSAWIDLLLMANHADNDCVMGKSLVRIKRGQLHTSINHLAKRWRWSDKKVRRYLTLLKDLQMVQIKGTPNGTTLTLVKYGVYQGKGQTNDPTNDPTNDTTNDPTNGTQTIKNNNVINNVSINKNKARTQTADDINAIFEKMKREGKL